MAEMSRVKPVTKQELDVFGVSMSIIARVGEKTFSASVSPVDFEIFKSDLYRNKLHQDVVKRIEHDLAKSNKPKESK